MNPDLKFRQISKDELGIVKRLADEIWPETYKNILSVQQIAYMMNLFYTVASLKEQMVSKKHRFIIAEEGGRPVAFASFGKMKEGVYKLHKIYVHSLMQGKGIGRDMITWITEKLREENAESLELNVNRNNKAMEFYMKLGFHILREEDIDIGAGYFMNDYVMQKAL